MKHRILAALLMIEPFIVEDHHQLQDVTQFCEVMATRGKNCDLANALLVYEQQSKKLISIVQIQTVREGTTALLSASSLGDFKEAGEIYKAMLEWIVEESEESDAWSGISWVAINREIFNHVEGLDEKRFPILFSLDEQLFAAIPIENLIQKSAGSINWSWMVGGLLSVGLPLIVYGLTRLSPSR